MEVRRLSEPLPPEPPRPEQWSQHELDPDHVASRRQWLMGMAGVIGGGAVAGSVGFVAGRSSEGDAKHGADWVDLMEILPEADLIAFAGIFELRLDAAPLAEARWRPAFERLLRAAIASSASGADRAGAVAARVLGRTGATDALREARGRVDAANRPWTSAEIERALSR